MSKIIVIAGTLEQAKQWIKQHLDKRMNAGETTLSYSDYVTVKGLDHLRGFSDPHGYFVGTWKQRPDIKQIVEYMLTNNTHNNKSIMSIYLDFHTQHSTHAVGDLRNLGDFQQVWDGHKWIEVK